MAKLGVSELPNPSTDYHKTWHGWWCWRCVPSNRSPQWRRTSKRI